MSLSPIDQYRALLNQLLFEREAAGGELPEGLESHFVERLDALWWKLSPEEQQEIDDELAAPAVATQGEEELALVDRTTPTGSHDAPRHRAA